MPCRHQGKTEETHRARFASWSRAGQTSTSMPQPPSPIFQGPALMPHKSHRHAECSHAEPSMHHWQGPGGALPATDVSSAATAWQARRGVSRDTEEHAHLKGHALQAGGTAWGSPGSVSGAQCSHVSPHGPPQNRSGSGEEEPIPTWVPAISRCPPTRQFTSPPTLSTQQLLFWGTRQIPPALESSPQPCWEQCRYQVARCRFSPQHPP